MHKKGEPGKLVEFIDLDAIELGKPEAQPTMDEILSEPSDGGGPQPTLPQAMETELVQPTAGLESTPPPVAPSIAPFLKPEVMNALNSRLLRSIRQKYGSLTKAGRSPEDILSEIWMDVVEASCKEKYRNLPPNEFEAVIWTITARTIVDNHRRVKSDPTRPIGIDYGILPESEETSKLSAQRVALGNMAMQAIANGIRERIAKRPDTALAKLLVVMFLDPNTTNQELMDLGLASTSLAARAASHRALNALEKIAGEALGIKKAHGRRKPRTKK